MTHYKTIREMHRYARPKGSATEQAFIDRFLTPLGFRRDTHLNLVLTVGERPRVLFSSHVDTVDRREGIKALTYKDGFLALSKRDIDGGFSCLGADDTAGVWLMTEMIKAGVEGVYVIHHGEESGCIGSSAKAGDTGFFDGIDIALAFDRAGYADVITHQCGGRTASEGFAWSLARALGSDFKPSAKGVYTDTNEYAGVVAECSNLSVGYFDQHTTRESLDVAFLIGLRDKLLAVDWSSLNVERQPDTELSRVTWRDDAFWTEESVEDSREMDRIESLVRQYPDVIATLLVAYGITAEEIEEEIGVATGRYVGSYF